MAGGAYGETGENAVHLVVVESKSACVIVPVLHQLMAAHNVQDLTKRPSSVIVYHAQVRKVNFKAAVSKNQGIKKKSLFLIL